MALKHVSEYMAGAIFGMVNDPKNVGLKREKMKSCRNTSGSTQSNKKQGELIYA